MLSSFLGQTSFDTTSFESSTTVEGGLFAGLFLFVLLFSVAIYVLSAIVLTKLFKKAGHPNPWAAWVPVYNGWVLMEIAGRPGWWALVGLAGGISFIGVIASIGAFVLSILASIDLAKSFGKEGSFAALLILLPFIGYPMLAFGDAQYHGPAGPEGNKFGGNANQGSQMPGQDTNQPPSAPTPPAGPAV